jgi:hypothetical protein
MQELQDRVFVPDGAPLGDTLSAKGSIRRELERAINDVGPQATSQAPRVLREAPPPSEPTLDGYDGYGSDELPSLATSASLQRWRILKAAKLAVAAGYRPPRTAAEHRRAAEVAGSLARHLSSRGRDRRPALSQYVRRRREQHAAEYLEAFWAAVADMLRGSKVLLRDQIRADREAGLSIRQIARMRGLSKSKVGRLSQEE